jgi:hypothetical protein
MPITLERKLLVTLCAYVHSQRLSPFGDDVAFVNDDAGRFAAVLDRPDGVAEGLAAESLVMIELEIARRLGLAGDRKVDRIFQERRTDARLGRSLVLPHRIGVVDTDLRRGPERDQQEDEQELGNTMSDHLRTLLKWT